MKKTLGLISIFSASVLALTACSAPAPKHYAGRCSEIYGVGSALFEVNNWLSESGGYDTLTAEERKSAVFQAGYTNVNEYLIANNSALAKLRDVKADPAIDPAEAAELDAVISKIDSYRSNFYSSGYDSEQVLSDYSAAQAVVVDKCDAEETN